MNATAPASDITCTNPACGAANRAGTRFCVTCGTAIAATATPAQPQAAPQPAYVPPPQPPRFNPSVAGMHGTPIAPDRFTDLGLPVHEAYDRAVAAMQSLNGEVASQNPPAFIGVLTRRMLGSAMRFRCQIIVQPSGAAGARVGIGIKPDWGSTLMFLGIIGGIGLFNVFFLTMSVGLWAPLLSIAGFGWAVYDVATGIPNRLAGQFQKALGSATFSAPPPTPTPAYAPAPPSAPAPASVPPVPNLAKAPAPAEEADIIAKIEKLAGLRDKGLIDAAEFERRRTDLLDRL